MKTNGFPTDSQRIRFHLHPLTGNIDRPTFDKNDEIMRHCFEAGRFDAIRIDALLVTFRDVSQMKDRSFGE